jgi:hypothetical protein
MPTGCKRCCKNAECAVISFQSHVVSAFEHSLANMTDRLTKLTTTSEKKVKHEINNHESFKTKQKITYLFVRPCTFFPVKICSGKKTVFLIYVELASDLSHRLITFLGKK